MGLLDFFTKRKKQNFTSIDSKTEKKIEETVKYTKNFNVKDKSTISNDDYLGLASNSSYKASIAMKEKDYNKAWEYFNEQRMYYLKHAESLNWNAKDTIRLSGGVHENLANIFRLEKKHHDALVNIIYTISTNEYITKGLEKKLKAYYNRANFTNTTYEEVIDYTYSLNYKTSMSQIQVKVKYWISKG